MKKLLNKVALITGGARGMGASHVRRFIAEGAKVYFTDILEEEGLKLTEELGSQAVFIKHDVANEEHWKVIVAVIRAEEGKLDILVNNAGIARVGALGEIPLADYMSVVNINQASVFLGLNYTLPLLKKGTNASVINISSVAGFKGAANAAAYCSSKYAVRGLTQVAAIEFAPFKIRVNSVHPGIIATPMVIQEDTKNQINEMKKLVLLGEIGKPEDVTNMVLFLASEDAAYCTGGEFVVDGGETAKGG